MPKPGSGTMLGHVVTVVLGLVLIAAGLWLGWSVVGPLLGASGPDAGAGGAADNGAWDGSWVTALLAAVCGTTGILTADWGASLVRHERTLTSLRRAHPAEPWRWRPEWTGRGVRSKVEGPAPLLAVCAWVAALALPLGSASLLDLDSIGDDGRLVMGLFAVSLAGSGWLAWRRLQAARWAGGAGLTLYLDRWPLATGGATPLRLASAPGATPLREVETRLVCEHAITTYATSRGARSSGTTTRRSGLWETRATHARLEPGHTLAWGVRLPDQLPGSTADPAAGARHEWRLEVRAPGLGRALAFPLPVFGRASNLAPSPGRPAADEETAAVSAWVTSEAIFEDDAGPAATAGEAPPATDLSAGEIAAGLAAQGIGSEWDGERLRSLSLPARRHLRVLLTLGTITLGWTALVAAMVWGGAPWIMSLGFGLFLAVFSGLFVQLVRSGRELRFDADGVRIGRPGRARDAPPVRLTNLRVEMSMRALGRQYYKLVARQAGADDATIVGNIEGALLARALGERVRDASRAPKGGRRARRTEA